MARRSFATTGRARLAWSMFALTVLFLIAMVVLSAGREDPFDTILYGLLALSTGGVPSSAIQPQEMSHPIGQEGFRRYCS